MSTPRELMNGTARFTSVAIVLAGTALWAGLAAWLFFLVRFEQRYEQTYFSRLRTHVDAPYYSPPAAIGFQDEKAVVWIRWSAPDHGFRWSDGKNAGVLFRLSGDAAKSVRALRFKTACVVGPLSITAVVNDGPIGTVAVNGPGVYSFPVPAGLLSAGVNSVDFLMPQAHRGASGDPRMLGMGLAGLALETSP